MTTYFNYINGEFITTGQAEDVINPSTNEVIAQVPLASQSDMEAAVDAAKAAQKAWALRAPQDRATYLVALASKLRENVDEIADILVREQGKIRGLAEVEVNFTADYLDYTAGWARRILGEVIPSDRPNESMYLLRKPVGVVAGILPWNFPFFLIARKAAPALLMGNTIVIKPSRETPLNAQIFTRILDTIGLPKGVFNLVNARGVDTAEGLVKNPKVDMVSMTGSVPTGAKIMADAAQNITKINLELGGKAPAIVLNDANLDLAVKSITDSRVINSGQVCNCAERVYVEKGIADEFISKVTANMAAQKYGDPGKHADVAYGPLINSEGRDRIHKLVQNAVGAGAEITTGGEFGEGDGWFYKPTVLTGVKHDSEIIREEIFGPVLPIVVVEDFDEAIEKANDTVFGLTSSLYTENLNNVMRGMREIDFGETYVNRENFEAMQGFHAGTRQSGIGGADGYHGVLEYTRTQVVYIETH